MKRNMVPLLAIAFVVAVISTGLFYGLFASKLINGSSDLPKQNVVVAARKLPAGAVLGASDLRVAEIRGTTAFGNAFTTPEQVIGATLLDPIDANQALTKSGLVSIRSPDAGSIAPGMRAVTIHVQESGGVLALLHPGSRVDIQAVTDRTSSPGESHTILRTIFQNIEVLSTAQAPLQIEQVGLRFSAPPVTVLIRVEDSDALAVADTGARLRLTLRNRLDKAGAERASVSWPAGLATAAARPRSQPHPSELLVATTTGKSKGAEGLFLLARVVAVTAKGADQLSASVANPLDRGTLNVTSFDSQSDPESLLRELESHHDLDLVSSTRMHAENGRSLAVGAESGLRLSLAVNTRRGPGMLPGGGTTVLRVQPVLSWPEAHGTATRSLTADLPMPFDRGFLISGLQLSPERASQGRQLMVIVTPASRAVVARASLTPRN